MGQQTIIRDGFVSKGDSQFNGSAEIINTSGFGLTITGSSAGAFIGNRPGGVHTLTMQADTAGRGLLILNSTGSTANYAVKGLDVNVQSNVSNIQSYAQVNIGTTQPLTLNSLGGFVGINTGNNVTPSAALHVKGSGATSSTTALRIENSNATSSLTVRDDGLISAMPNNANITIDGSTSSGGRIIIQNPSSNSLIGINSYNTFLYPTELVIFAGSAIKGYINGLGDFRFYNLSTSKTYMYISTTGLIGINKGTVTPNAELDVSGSVIVTGSLKVTGGITGSLQGTASYALTASFIDATFISASAAASGFGSGGGGGSGTVNSGTAGKVAYYATTGTAVSETGTLKWDDGNNSLGVGVAAPTNANYKLAVNGGIDIGNDTTAVLRIGAHLAGSGYPQAVIQMGANATRFDFEKYGGGVQFTVSSSGDCKVSNSLGVGMDASGTSGRIDASNDIVAFSTSDIRWKTNIKPIENPIEKIKQISGNTFEWIEDSKFHGNTGKDVGVIAQEIEAILPEIVTTRDTGMKAVKYEKLVALLIEAVKEQQKQIDELKAKL